METHFIVHDKASTVGVMVVENAAPGHRKFIMTKLYQSA
jgi:hypothetical protein